MIYSGIFFVFIKKVQYSKTICKNSFGIKDITNIFFLIIRENYRFFTGWRSQRLIKKSFKNSPRECDIDILDYDNKKTNEQIILPHPRMHKRSFVLLPLFEINKAWKHPLKKRDIKSLISTLSNRDIRSIKQI